MASRSPSRERSPSPYEDAGIDVDTPPSRSNAQSDDDVEEPDAEGEEEERAPASKATKPKEKISTRPKRVEEILELLKGATFESVAESLIVELLRVVHCARENSPELRSFARAMLHYLVVIYPKWDPLRFC